MKTLTYDEAAPAIGRGSPGGTLKEFKAGLDAYLKRTGQRRIWNPEKRRSVKALKASKRLSVERL